MRALLMPLVLATLIGGVVEGGEAAPTFTTKPTASKTGDRVKIAFAVSAPTDVAVYIEDAKGSVVRHLVAGVLGGTNPPPAPLKPGLAQEVEWDGKADYDKPAEGGPFKVRVGLGLGTKLERVMSRPPPEFSGGLALGCGPDGALYVRHSDFPAIWGHAQVVALNRDGSYRRTLVPFAATPDNREAQGFSTMSLGGALVPAFTSERGPWSDLFPAGGGILGSNLAVGRDGKTLYAPTTGGVAGILCGGGALSPFVVALEKAERSADPKKPTPPYAFTGMAALCLSSDGKRLFATGVASEKGRPAQSAVFQLAAPERGVARPFFGDPAAAGKDQAHLGANPGGLAVDGRGALLVADPANGRIVVLDEADGKFRGEVAIEKPQLLGVGAAGVLYAASVSRGGFQLTRLAIPAPAASGALDWSTAKPAGTMLVPSGTDLSQSLAVDTSAAPTVLWLSGGLRGQLFRIEDSGDGKFAAKQVSVGNGSPGKTEECYLGLVVDRRTKEVYVRNGNHGGVWERIDDATGKSEMLSNMPGKGGGGTGNQYTPGPDGNLYGLQWPWSFYRLDRNAKPLAFTNLRAPTDEEMKLNFPRAKWDASQAHRSYVPVAMGELPHTLGVRWSDGHLFIIEPWLFSPDRKTPNESCGGRTTKAMHEYLPDGKRVTATSSPIIWKLSDAAVGPKFDPQGNIYVAEAVRPAGWVVPPELVEHFRKKGIEPKVAGGKRGDWYARYDGELGQVANFYGSILKFSPKGGMVHWDKNRAKGLPGNANCGSDPFEGEPKLDTALKTTDLDLVSGGYLRLLKVTGAEWVKPGMGHVGFFGCNCENATFEVDEFGRVFYPDFHRYRVVVLDTAGNDLAAFGGYGNPDNRGPDSPVIDAKTGQPRPRRADDPKDLKSPFAEPEIAVAWPASVGATDRHLYIGDALNRRMLQAKLVYAAEESCEAK